MSKVDIEAIRQRLERATPGPWQPKHLLLHPDEDVAVGDSEGWHVADCQTTGRTREEVAANVDFIVHAPTDIAALLFELAALRAALEPFAQRATQYGQLAEDGQLVEIRLGDLRRAAEAVGGE